MKPPLATADKAATPAVDTPRKAGHRSVPAIPVAARVPAEDHAERKSPPGRAGTLARHVSALVATARHCASTVLRSYPELPFLRGTRAGWVVCLVTWLTPHVGLAGLVACLSAYAFARAVGARNAFLASGFHTYNPLLVGLALGYQLAPAWSSLVFVAIAGAATFVVGVMLEGLLSTLGHLPPLTLPYVVTIGAAQLAVLRYSNLLLAEPLATSATDDLGLPLVASAFFRSFGALLFVPSVVAGLAFSILTLLRSRLLLLLGVGGFYGTVLVRWLWLGSFDQALSDPLNYNGMLVAMAVGGVFLTPSLSSYAIAAVAVAATALLLDALEVLGAGLALSAYTLPFNLVTLSFVYALRRLDAPSVPRLLGKTPEETVEIALATRRRFPDHRRTLRLPFYGAWTVWQACDDVWTHQGPWRHAYDFVVTDDDGRTHAGGGAALEDYYGFRKPVLAPVSGRVVRVVADLPDNPVGRVDQQHPWGNLVVIHDERGFFVELSHFAQGSLRVRVGEWVEAGAVLGLCGNSGNSPQPHLHVQVQAASTVGDATLPFAFVAYRHADTYYAFGLPAKGAQVEPVAFDPALDRATTFLLDDRLTYQLHAEGRPPQRVQWTVRMALDGTYFFESATGARLYFGKHDGGFFCYRVDGRDPALECLYRAVPMLPLAAARDLTWRDALPTSTLLGGWRRQVARFLAPLVALGAVRAVELRFTGPREIESRATIWPFGAPRCGRVVWDDRPGFALIQSNHLTLRRDDDALD